MIKHEKLTQQIRAGVAAQARKELVKQARAAEQVAWRVYRDEVRRLTELQPLDRVPGIGLRGAAFHLDHVVSIRRAWLENWSPERCANVSNLQMLSQRENFAKGTASFCSLALHQRLTSN
jgi:hypothetical protein